MVNLAFTDDEGGGALQALPRRPAADATVSVRIGHRLLSPAPKVVDDFSASTLLSALRVLQKIRNLDGPDDIASALPAAFTKAEQPYVEIGLLAMLFPLVAISAVGAVRNAMNGYSVRYPAALEKMLAQQQALLEALRRDGTTQGMHRVAGETEADLALLSALHQASVAHFADQQSYRQRGFARLALHNIGNRWMRVRGNGELSNAFNQEVARIMARRMANTRMLASVDTSYQLERLEKTERERHATKVGRTAALFSGTGMSAMAAGMPVSASAALAQAVKSGFAQRFLERATGSVMGGAQAMQLASGAIQLHLHRRNRQQVHRDLNAVRSLDAQQDGLSGPARSLYQTEAAYQRDAANRGMALSGLLTGGQGLMLASSATGFFAAPVAAGLAVPGAVITVAGSILASLQEDHLARHVGAGALEVVRDTETIGDLGPQLRSQGLAATTSAIGHGSVAQQKQTEQTRMWNDICDALSNEKPMTEQRPTQPLQRHDRVARNNRRLRGRSTVGPECVQALEALRQQRYPLQFFQRRLTEIHRALAGEMAGHPHAALIVRQPGFRQQVLFATLKDLSQRSDARNGPLFFDASGRRVERVRADTFFFQYLAANPPAAAVYRQKHNEQLARHLTPGHLFARNEHHEALTDLAHTSRQRMAMAASARIDPDRQATAM